jgi:amino acid transporter
MFFAVWTQWRYAVVLDLDFVQQIVLCFHRSSKLGHSGAAACFMKNDAGKLNFAEITAIGIGGMIGGGIFAVLGLAISVARHAVVLTVADGGVIAFLTGLSYAHLGLAFRGDGGSFTYIERAFAAPAMAGIAGWLLIVGYIGTLALYATAFGDYGAALMRSAGIPLAPPGLLATLVLGASLVVKLLGRSSPGVWNSVSSRSSWRSSRSSRRLASLA